MSDGYVPLRLTPVSLADAHRFIAEHHRHNDPPVGHKASVGVSGPDGLVAVGSLSRPVARNADDGRTLEIIRVASDGTKNACSMVYRALVRVAWNLGYERVITYTLADEPGTSLRASGWTHDGEAGGGEWKRTDGDPRALDKPTLFYSPKAPTGRKVRWVIERNAL